MAEIIAYAVRGNQDGTRYVCLSESEALLKGIELSKLMPSITFSIVPLIEQPYDDGDTAAERDSGPL